MQSEIQNMEMVERVETMNNSYRVELDDMGHGMWFRDRCWQLFGVGPERCSNSRPIYVLSV